MEPEYLDDLAALNKDGGDYIRLLRVLAPTSRPQEAMLCELRVFSLGHAPEYFALSYCRQPEDGVAIVEVRGSFEGSFPVSCDLESATRALHEFRPSDWFWIDAVCINQFSNNEKNDQVPRMREIYETAHAGMIWLGIDVQSKVEYTFRGGSTNLVHLEDGDSVFLEIIEPKIGSKEARDADLGLTHGKVMQLARLAERHRAWWCRTWIIQEMVLPTELYVCIGSQVMLWHRLLSASSNWRWYSTDHGHALQAAYHKLRSLDNLRKQWHLSKYSLAIFDLLRLGRESYATDARDNVYGILGLVNPQERQHIQVDYSCAVDQMYAGVTTMLINRYQSIDILLSSFWHKTETSQAWLPSWVVDYRPESYDQRQSLGPSWARNNWSITTEGYKAGGDAIPFPSNNKHALKLHLEAVVLDRVVEISPSEQALSEEYRPGRPHTAWTVPQWLRSWLISAIGLIRSASARKSSPFDPRDILHRTCDTVRILMQAHRWERLPNDFWAPSRLVLEDDRMLDDILLNIEHLNDKIVRERLRNSHVGYRAFDIDIHKLRHKTLFATECGFTGWAKFDPLQSSVELGPSPSHSVRKEDIIVVPRGASMPWVLRETDVDGEYKLITDCAVYGVMDGELMALVKSGHLHTQQFTLV